MSKILQATCSASGQVSCEGFVVEDTIILGEGKAASEGLLFIERDKKAYIPKTVADLVSTLDKVSKALEQVATALNSIDQKPTGGAGSAPTPVAVAQVAQINTIKGELDTLKGTLK